jgi:hypothetical protein
VRAGHQLEDDARLPVLAGAEHEGFIGPVHGKEAGAAALAVPQKILIHMTLGARLGQPWDRSSRSPGPYPWEFV